MHTRPDSESDGFVEGDLIAGRLVVAGTGQRLDLEVAAVHPAGGGGIDPGQRTQLNAQHLLQRVGIEGVGEGEGERLDRLQAVCTVGGQGGDGRGHEGVEAHGLSTGGPRHARQRRPGISGAELECALVEPGEATGVIGEVGEVSTGAVLWSTVAWAGLAGEEDGDGIPAPQVGVRHDDHTAAGRRAEGNADGVRVGDGDRAGRDEQEEGPESAVEHGAAHCAASWYRRITASGGP